MIGVPAISVPLGDNVLSASEFDANIMASLPRTCITRLALIASLQAEDANCAGKSPGMGLFSFSRPDICPELSYFPIVLFQLAVRGLRHFAQVDRNGFLDLALGRRIRCFGRCRDAIWPFYVMPAIKFDQASLCGSAEASFVIKTSPRLTVDILNFRGPMSCSSSPILLLVGRRLFM